MSGIAFFRGEDPLRADKLNAAFSERVLRVGDTMIGMLTLSQDPVQPFHAVTKQYVDTNYRYALLAEFLPLTGGIMQGPIALSADPSTAMHAATKQYVDSQVATGVGATPSTTLPLVEGTAAIGVLTTYARADHVHPTGGGGSSVTVSDTAPASPMQGDMWYDSTSAQLFIRYDDGSSSQWVIANTANNALGEVPLPSGVLPLANGVAAVGVATEYARGDHVHPAAVATAPVVVSDTAPTIGNGILWFDSVGAKLYVGYNDGTSTQWILVGR